MKQADWAQQLARGLLARPLSRRWAHTRGVAAQARSLAPLLGDDADLIEAAAWLHDIGYSPGLVDTGFHPLDGARYLRDVERADDLLCCLVAHHSAADTEAEDRGLAGELLAEFPVPPYRLAAALTYSDMTTSPDGFPVAVEERLAEVHVRYGFGHVVSRAISKATPQLIADVMLYRENERGLGTQFGSIRPLAAQGAMIQAVGALAAGQQ